MVRKIHERHPGDLMKALNVNLNTTLRAAVHLGKDYNTNLRNTQAGQWSDRHHWHKHDRFQELRWVSTSLLHGRSCQYSTAKVYVCLEKMGDDPVESWKRKIHWYSDDNHFIELNRIGGQLMEFEWKIFPDSLQWESSIRFNR